NRFFACSCRHLLGLPEGELLEADIRKGYRAAARRLHPDRGGKREEFQELQRCYESVLAEVSAAKDGKARHAWLEQMKKDFANFSCC
ncbi:unnamed protein product, partial [Symbiodinium sp. CCMP2456]